MKISNNSKSILFGSLLLMLILGFISVLFISGLFCPKAFSLDADSLRASVVEINGASFIAVNGPPLNIMGAHQYIVYSVDESKVKIGLFCTRIVLPNRGGFQNDWPVIIPSSKFLNKRTLLTCSSGNQEEVIATVIKSDDVLKIESE